MRFIRRFSSSAFVRYKQHSELRRGEFGYVTDKNVVAFERILGVGGVLTNPEDVDFYNNDWLKTCRGHSKVVLKPKVTEQLSQIMKICHQNRLAVCPQGGNTGLVGGSVPVFDEIVISMSSMNEINHVDPISGVVSCQAGVVLEKLETTLEIDGLMAPQDLGARGSCQIGGNISTCAGGLRLLRYGSMLANTLGIEAVLADGTILDVMGSLKKDNTGYHLRQLFVGSEGTLGIVTQAVIQCPIVPKSVNLALLTLKNFDDVLSTMSFAKRSLSEILSSCEMMDSFCVSSVENKLGLKYPLNYDSDTFFMLIETQGSHEEHDAEKLTNFIEEAMNKGLIIDGTTTNEPSKMRKMWEIRERIVDAFTAGQFPLIYDLTLPLDKFYECVHVLSEHLSTTLPEAKVAAFGHLGDGNVHLNAVVPELSEKAVSVVEPFIYEWTGSVGGSVSAEHGLGLKKTKFIKYSKTPAAIAAMRNLKHLMDPLGILNPHKVLPPL